MFLRVFSCARSEGSDGKAVKSGLNQEKWQKIDLAFSWLLWNIWDLPPNICHICLPIHMAIYNHCYIALSQTPCKHTYFITAKWSRYIFENFDDWTWNPWQKILKCGLQRKHQQMKIWFLILGKVKQIVSKPFQPSLGSTVKVGRDSFFWDLYCRYETWLKIWISKTFMGSE